MIKQIANNCNKSELSTPPVPTGTKMYLISSKRWQFDAGGNVQAGCFGFLQPWQEKVQPHREITYMGCKRRWAWTENCISFIPLLFHLYEIGGQIITFLREKLLENVVALHCKLNLLVSLLMNR